jgi:predicted Zn-dependent protease with MMP-like domain
MAKRTRGSSRHRTAPGASARFDELVQRALATIPEPFARALDEVAIVIDDEPSRQQRLEAGLRPGDGLYGLYEGVPRTEYGADWDFIPNKITIFQTALQEDFPDAAELEHEVWVTVVHELAHHLGIPDERLHELGVD